MVPSIRIALCTTTLALASCATARHAIVAQPSAPPVSMSALPSGHGLQSISYAGRWQFVTGRRDGRYADSSARSFHPGDSMTIIFKGDRVRIYGVTGPNGGSAVVVVPPKHATTIDFRSGSKQTHRLLYDSGVLKNGVHSAGVVVARAPRRRAGYVNLDEIIVL